MQTNQYIKTLYPTGKYLPSAKYTHKQCGEYINDNFLNSRQVSSTWASKKSLVDRFGFKKGKGVPQTGDCVMMDYATAAGHISIINSVSDDKKVYTFTDCNRSKPGVVDNDFRVVVGDANWNRIYGFARLKLNIKTQNAQPKLEIPSWAKEAVEWAKKEGLVIDWTNPFEVIGNQKLEWILEKEGVLDPKNHEGYVTLVRYIVGKYNQK